FAFYRIVARMMWAEGWCRPGRSGGSDLRPTRRRGADKESTQKRTEQSQLAPALNGGPVPFNTGFRRSDVVTKLLEQHLSAAISIIFDVPPKGFTNGGGASLGSADFQ